jgi:hypothetical protein
MTEILKQQFDCRVSQIFVSPPVQIGSKDPLTHLSNWYRMLFHRGKKGRGMTPTARLHLVPTKLHSDILLHDKVLN